MEKHFLDGMMEGTPEFRAEPWYNACGDCIIYKMVNEATVAQRVDELLTVYHSAVDDRPVGFQIKGIRAIITKFGLDGLLVSSEAGTEGVRRISITALLLAAYENGPRTVGRRIAYATAMECPTSRRTISTDELQPA